MSLIAFGAEKYVDLTHTAHLELFENDKPIWNALNLIEAYLKNKDHQKILASVHPQAVIGEHVHIGKGTVVEAGVVIKGPAWIGENCQLRSGCYVRENVVVGNGVVMGNSCEFKNSIIFDAAEVPHFNYVGDAILGYKAHLGAGVILSNVRLDRAEVKIAGCEGWVGTGRKKFSAVVGDRTEIGCNAVISPGTLLGRDCLVYPCATISGEFADQTIVKVRQNIQRIKRKLDQEN
jgi:UDP-N-acetylglucosamine diphosphorylase / glucose-1-phosphate thymidylyltransferase / UDP-N-acetylgalactosamine diphosphorylase / glucosamine-1-phosphate N-acetyltransferase / galactosamine-1-phosphate N-acetyltransferase